jgi:hypothetical protein
MSAILYYFDNNHKLSDIKYLPKGFKTNQTKEVLGFNYEGSRGSYDVKEYFNHTLVDDNALLDIKGYDYYMDFAPYKLNNMGVSENDVKVEYTPEDKVLKIVSQGKVIYTRDISEAALKIHNRSIGKNTLTKEKMTFDEDTQNVKVRFIFKQISGSEDKAEIKTNIEATEFYLFVTIK